MAGILLKIASTLALAATMAAIKLLDGGVSLGLIVFVRSFLFLPVLLIWLGLRKRLGATLRTADPFGHVVRGMIGAMGMLVWFSAIQCMPLPNVQAIAFAGPLIAVVLAVVMLGEKVHAFRWSAVAIGFIGIIVLLSEQLPGKGAGDMMGALLALNFAVLSALASIQIRRLTGAESTETIVVYFSIVTSLFGLATLPFGWEMPNLREGALLVFIGLAGGISQMLLTHALRYAEASALAPFDYLSMIWVVAFSFVLFDEIPSWMTIAGTLIVVAAGIAVIFREQQLRRKARRMARRAQASGLED